MIPPSFRLARILFVLLILPGVCRAAEAPAPAENVLMVTTDGLRWQEVFNGAEEARLDPKDEATKRAFWRDSIEARRAALMPFLWGEVAAKGQVWGNQARGSVAKVTNGLKFSYPGYQELLAGFPDPRIDSNDKKPNPNVTVLEWLNGRPAFKGKVAAFGNWDVLPYIVNRERSRLPGLWSGEDIAETPLTEAEATINALRRDVPSPWGGAHYDAFTHHQALDYATRHKPCVLYILYGDTDERAHEGVYGEYLRAAHRFDGFVKQLWELAQSLPEYKGKTALLVATDHGRGDGPKWTDHGKKIDGAENIWFAAMGPGVAPLGERSGVGATQGQYAATAAALLGLDYPAAEHRAAPALDLNPAARKS